MTAWQSTSAVIGVVLVAGAFALGRSMAPTRVIEHTRTVETEGKTVFVESKQAASAEARVDQGVRWRTRTIYRPGGVTEVIKTVERKDEHETKTASATAATSNTVETRTVEVERLKLIENARPNWSVGAAAGLGLDGRLRYQGEVSRRIVGGLWLTAGVDVSGKAGLLGARLEF